MQTTWLKYIRIQNLLRYSTGREVTQKRACLALSLVAGKINCDHQIVKIYLNRQTIRSLLS